MGGGKKRVKSAEKSRKARFSLRKEQHVLMSSDEDEPAPSPSATVLARRASRVVKPMREESSSDDDVRKNQKSGKAPTRPRARRRRARK